MVRTQTNEPQSANEYGDRTTGAVKSVLLEMGQILGSFNGKFTVVGGSVPWLLLEADDMEHVGTMDVDIALSAEALGDGEYATLIESLQAHGYEQREGGRRFQLHRTVPAIDNEGTVDVVIDFLMPKDAVIVKNDPPLIPDFAVQRASGADLAIKFYEMVAIKGNMPNGGTNRVEIAVCSVPALLAMKGHAMNGRYKQKDAYDIYYSIRNYAEGIDTLAASCLDIIKYDSGRQGFDYIDEKFDDIEGYGPTCVRNFVEGSKILGDRTPDEWRQDAFGQVDALLRAMALRK